MSRQKKSDMRSTGPRDREAPADRLRRWMRTQLGVFTALDTDRNGRVDDAELDRAVKAAFEWLSRAESSQACWFYGDGPDWIGPVSWTQVAERGRRQKWLPVRLDDETLWLPYAAIVEAGRLVPTESHSR